MEMVNIVVTTGWEADKGFRRPGCGQGRAIEVRREEGGSRAAQWSHRTNECSHCAGEHLGAIEGERLRPQKRGPARVKYVHAHVISIRPNPKVRIIEKIRAEMKSIT